MTSATVTRVDRAGGFSEEAAFLDFAGTEVFAVTHLPLNSARGGVVVCSPILVEHLTNYRHEVLLARALAQQGLAVQRFHYRGTGHSQGQEEEIGLSSMVADARMAADHLRARIGLTSVVFVGTRWGALVAAEVARDDTYSPLLFWDPVLDGARYFRELIRARLVRELKDVRFAGSAADSWREELNTRGWVDILGYPLHRGLHDSGQGRRLDEMLMGRRGPVLVVQFGRGGLQSDHDRLQEAVTGGGGSVEVRLIRDEPAWLFPGHRMRSADKLVSLSVAWLVKVAGAAGRV